MGAGPDAVRQRRAGHADRSRPRDGGSAFASVVLALCLPLFIPGLHMTRLFGGGQPGIGGSGGGAGSGGALGFPDPNVQLSQELRTEAAE